MIGLDQETGIYNDLPPGRWPLCIMRPASTGFVTFYRTCPTPYMAPMARDATAFRAAMEQGRNVCPQCVAWLQEQGLLPAVNPLNKPPSGGPTSATASPANAT